MKHVDAAGNPKRASLPDTMAPDELTVQVGRDLIDNNAGGPRELGVDPASGGTVEVRNGRFGPYVALVPSEGRTPGHPRRRVEEDRLSPKPEDGVACSRR